MKTTTKILICTFAVLLFLTVVYIAGLSACLDVKTGYSVNNRSCTEKRVPECSYLRIDSTGLKRLGLLTGTLNITTPQDSAKSGLFIFPTELEKNIHFAKEGDTLVIRFVGIEDFLKEKNIYALQGANFYYCPKKLLGIKDYTLLRLIFRDFSSKQPLQVTAEHAFVEFADSCNVSHLLADKAISLKLRNSRIDTLSLDLDGVKDWKVENCMIHQENLFGSGKHNVYIPRSETTVMKWFPKTKKSSLSVEFSDTPAKIEYQE